MNLPEPPLSPDAEKLRDAILEIPRTSEPFEDYPEGIDADLIEYLYYGTQDGDPTVIPELKRQIALHPEYPTLQNFLRVYYHIRNNPRQAAAVLGKMAQQHPDYLFSRLGLCEEILHHKRPPEQVLQHLGADLDLAKLYPGRTVFHVTEIRCYYHLAGSYYALIGRQDLTRGVMAALETIEPDSPVLKVLEYEIMMANMRKGKAIRDRDARIRRVVVTQKPSRIPTGAPPPEFTHPEVEILCRTGMDIAEVDLRSILALPRESLVADLILVLEDAIVRTPDFLLEESDENSCGPLHAIHLLAEIDAIGAADVLLRFFTLDDEAIQFWLGDFPYDHLYARIVADSVPQVTDLLKAPGIHRTSKAYLSTALVRLVEIKPERRGEIVDALASVLRHMLEASPEDNVVDTAAISFIIGDCIDLRAVELEPLIEQLWNRELIEQMVCGDLDDIRAGMREAPRPPTPQKDIFEMYRSYASYGFDPEDEDGPGDDIVDFRQPGGGSPLYDLPGISTEPAVGRNDPCPCGSGKKYKKCCLK